MTFIDFSHPEFWISFHVFSMLIGFHLLSFVANFIIAKVYVEQNQISSFKTTKFAAFNLIINLIAIIGLTLLNQNIFIISELLYFPYLTVIGGLIFSFLILFVNYGATLSIILYSKNGKKNG